MSKTINRKTLQKSNRTELEMLFEISQFVKSQVQSSCKFTIHAQNILNKHYQKVFFFYSNTAVCELFQITLLVWATHIQLVQEHFHLPLSCVLV